MPYNLTIQLNELQKELDSAVRKMGINGMKRAEAEHDYRVAKGKETLKLHDQGMPATLIKTLVDANTADLRQERDTRDALYKTAQEKINALKIHINTVREEIEREWTKNE